MYSNEEDFPELGKPQMSIKKERELARQQQYEKDREEEKERRERLLERMANDNINFQIYNNNRVSDEEKKKIVELRRQKMLRDAIEEDERNMCRELEKEVKELRRTGTAFFMGSDYFGRGVLSITKTTRESKEPIPTLDMNIRRALEKRDLINERHVIINLGNLTTEKLDHFDLEEDQEYLAKIEKGMEDRYRFEHRMQKSYFAIFGQYKFNRIMDNLFCDFPSVEDVRHKLYNLIIQDCHWDDLSEIDNCSYLLHLMAYLWEVRAKKTPRRFALLTHALAQNMMEFSVRLNPSLFGSNYKLVQHWPIKQIRPKSKLTLDDIPMIEYEDICADQINIFTLMKNQSEN